MVADSREDKLKAVALLLSLQLFTKRGLRCDDQNLTPLVDHFRTPGFRPQEVEGALALVLQLYQRAKINGIVRSKLARRQLFKGRQGRLRFHGLPGLAPRQIGGFQPARVIFVLGLVLLVRGFGVRRLGGAEVPRQFRRQLSENFFDERAFVDDHS